MLISAAKFAVFLIVSAVLAPTINAVRSFPHTIEPDVELGISSMQFSEAPEYSNGLKCPILVKDQSDSFICNPSLVHIAMTIDIEYLRGSLASVHSILKHTSCPENIFFHFIASDSHLIHIGELIDTVRSTFPSLSFKVYIFRESIVKNIISSSIRQALENPLNYARSYLTDLLEPCINRVIYLDSDTIVVDDIQKLWRVSLRGSRVIGAPEYCHVDINKYFTSEFWSHPELTKVFVGKRPCYFNTGVMIMDLGKWREGDYTVKIEKWMRIQKEKRIYELGSLPPFLLIFGGEIEGIDHRWNQHGLGGDNVMNSCRTLHPGPVSLLHWSGKGKPWMRLDSEKPCPVDFLWASYDLYKPGYLRHEQSLKL